MSRSPSISKLAPLVAGLALIGACDSDGVSSVQDDETTVSVFLTDAPGDVAAVWIDIAGIHFQGGPGGRMDLVTEPTGLIEVTELVGTARALVEDLALDPGTYRQLRFVLAGAVLETSGGDVYVFGGAEHPNGLAATGDLHCPGCASSGLKVKLAGDAVDVADGANGLVLDFDVSQSFGRPAGNSGRWIMHPVIHAVRTEAGGDPGAPSTAGAIRGTVALGEDETGSPVVLPQCPSGQDRTLEDFVPVALAATLTDGDGVAIRRTGSVDGQGAFEIGALEADTYTLGYEPESLFDAFRLVWTATAEPGSVTVDADTDAEGVAYTVRGAVCEPIPAG